MPLQLLKDNHNKIPLGKSKQAAWIIDAAYLFESAKAFGVAGDVCRLKTFLEKHCKVSFTESHYVTGVPHECRAQYKSFLSWLSKPAPKGPGFIIHPYNLRRRTHRCQDCHSSQTRWVQKSVDVAIAMQLVKAAQSHEHIILLAGDADFIPAVQYVKNIAGKKVTVVAFSGCVSGELLKLADKVVLLDKHLGQWQSRPSSIAQ
jgi:uncharacterized LabA/DUF88 family protein